MNKKTAEILVIYCLVIFICVKVSQIYSHSTDVFSIPSVLFALLIGLTLGTIVNLIYFKFKKRDKEIPSKNAKTYTGIDSVNTIRSYQSQISHRKTFVDATVNRYQYGKLLVFLLAVFVWLIYALYSLRCDVKSGHQMPHAAICSI